MNNKDKKLSDKSFPMSTKANMFPLLSNQFAKSHDHQTQTGAVENSNEGAECLVVSMFCNADHGLLVYDSYARGEIYSKLISVRIPYHFFVTKVIDNDFFKSLVLCLYKHSFFLI